MLRPAEEEGRPQESRAQAHEASFYSTPSTASAWQQGQACAWRKFLATGCPLKGVSTGKCHRSSGIASISCGLMRQVVASSPQTTCRWDWSGRLRGWGSQGTGQIISHSECWSLRVQVKSGSESCPIIGTFLCSILKEISLQKGATDEPCLQRQQSWHISVLKGCRTKSKLRALCISSQVPSPYSYSSRRRY